MDKSQQVLSIIKKIRETKPSQALDKVSGLDSGMSFVLMYLIENNNEVYASTISEKMNISRARMGFLLKKMENKGFIIKKVSHKDARIEVINITNKGLERCNEIQSEIIKHIIKLIDVIGYDALNDFLDMACKIKNIMEGEQNV